jgi:hypothetical protein
MIHMTQSDVMIKTMMDANTRRQHQQLLTSSSPLMFLSLPHMRMASIALQNR